MLVAVVPRQTYPFCISSQGQKNLRQRAVSVCGLLNWGCFILFPISLGKINPARTKAKISITTYIPH